METFNKIKELVTSMEEDAEKFYSKGNKASGSRLRKSLQEIKKTAQEMRIEIQNKKNAA